MLDKDIKFDERVDSTAYGTTTLYFKAPKKYLHGKYPEASSCEISVEFPFGKAEAAQASVEFSPTMSDDAGDTDYEWFDVDLPYDEIEELIDIGLKASKTDVEFKFIINDDIDSTVCYKATYETSAQAFAFAYQYSEDHIIKNAEIEVYRRKVDSDEEWKLENSRNY